LSAVHFFIQHHLEKQNQVNRQEYSFDHHSFSLSMKAVA
jgi:hypothetical protein